MPCRGALRSVIFDYWSLRDLRGAQRFKRHFHPALCLMGGGEASRLMGTAEAFRAEMPIEKNIFHTSSNSPK